MSLTVTVKLHVVAPVAQATVVVPIGKVEPEGGSQRTGGVSPVSGSTQFPDGVGVV